MSQIKRIPHPSIFEFSGARYTAREVVDLIGPFLTDERLQRVEAVLAQRTYSVVPVVENLYDRGNVSAVMRSAEGHGLQAMHVIESGEKFKAANRVTSGADKWLDVRRWPNTKDCISNLKDQGYRLYVSNLEASVPIQELDFTVPCAVVFGNEKEGVSPEMAAAADANFIIPMLGFAQSFNISVAAAVTFYHIYQQRLQRLGRHGDLTPEEMEILKAVYLLKHTERPADLLHEARLRQVQSEGRL